MVSLKKGNWNGIRMEDLKSKIRRVKRKSTHLLPARSLTNSITNTSTSAALRSRPQTLLVRSIDISIVPSVREVELKLVNFREQVSSQDFIVVIERLEGVGNQVEDEIKCWPKSAALGKPFMYSKGTEQDGSMTLPRIYLSDGHVTKISIGIYQWQREYTTSEQLFDHLLVQGSVDLDKGRVGKLRKKISW